MGLFVGRDHRIFSLCLPSSAHQSASSFRGSPRCALIFSPTHFCEEERKQAESDKRIIGFLSCVLSASSSARHAARFGVTVFIEEVIIFQGVSFVFSSSRASCMATLVASGIWPLVLIHTSVVMVMMIAFIITLGEIM